MSVPDTNYESPYPRLDDVVKADDVSQKGQGNFAASFVNWSRICHYLREHAAGWQPFYVPAPDGTMCWAAPDGTFYLMIGFRKSDGVETEPVIHAIMDHKMNAKSSVSARDISDAYVRGVCKAAALLFGLGWRLWSKDDPFERDEEPSKPAAKKKKAKKGVTFANKVDALKGLDAVRTKQHIERWVGVIKDSNITDSDRDDLIEAYRERLAIIEVDV